MLPTHFPKNDSTKVAVLAPPAEQVSSVASRAKNVFAYRLTQTILVFIYKMSYSITNI